MNYHINFTAVTWTDDGWSESSVHEEVIRAIATGPDWAMRDLEVTQVGSRPTQGLRVLDFVQRDSGGVTFRWVSGVPFPLLVNDGHHVVSLTGEQARALAVFVLSLRNGKLP